MKRVDSPPEDFEPEEGDRVLELRNGIPHVYLQSPSLDKNEKPKNKPANRFKPGSKGI